MVFGRLFSNIADEECEVTSIIITHILFTIVEKYALLFVQIFITVEPLFLSKVKYAYNYCEKIPH